MDDLGGDSILLTLSSQNNSTSRSSFYPPMKSVSALVTDGFTVRINNDGVAPTIADDRQVASIQSESLPLVFGDKLFDRLTYFGRPAPASLALHGDLLCPKPDSIGFQRTIRDSIGLKAVRSLRRDWLYMISV